MDFWLANHSLAPSANSLGIDTAVLVSVIVGVYLVAGHYSWGRNGRQLHKINTNVTNRRMTRIFFLIRIIRSFVGFVVKEIVFVEVSNGRIANLLINVIGHRIAQVCKQRAELVTVVQ